MEKLKPKEQKVLNYVKSFKSNYVLSALYSRFPEIELYLEKMEQHVTERDQSGYVRNELEVYLRSPANNIIKNNVVVGTSVCFNQPALMENGKNLGTFDSVGENFHLKSYDGVFVDFANGDFTINSDLLEDVKLVIPDFKPLDASKCGLTTK